jgi:hypothetical protein
MQRRTTYDILLLLFLIPGLIVSGVLCRWHSGAASLVKADVSSADLAASFDNNESLADSLYLYKVLSVRGIVEKIMKKESGNYVITLGNRTPGRSVVDCHLDTIYNHRYLSLRNGDSVTIRGTCAGRLLNVILMQCIIEK